MNHPPPIPSKKNNNKQTKIPPHHAMVNNQIMAESCLVFFFLASVEISLTTYRPNFLLKKITVFGLHARVIVGKDFRHSEHSSMLAIIAMTS